MSACARACVYACVCVHMRCMLDVYCIITVTISLHIISEFCITIAILSCYVRRLDCIIFGFVLYKCHLTD